jgi:hypothetical protein
LWGDSRIGQKDDKFGLFLAPSCCPKRSSEWVGVSNALFCFHFLLQPIQGSPHFLSGLVALAQLTDYYDESMVNNKEEEEEEEKL